MPIHHDIRLNPSGLSALQSGCITFRNYWIDSAPDDIQPGELVSVTGLNSEFLGLGYYNPESKIPLRFLTRENTSINGEFWKKRFNAASSYRNQFYAPDDSYRLVFGEADQLPGLIIDKFGSLLVLQITTAGMERFKDEIIKNLVDVYSPDCIILACDSLPRKKEGLPLYREVAHGSYQPPFLAKIDGVHHYIDPLIGHKTGFFLDHRENRKYAASFCRDRRVLDIFSYSCAFGISAALQGADHVTCVDIFEPGLALGQITSDFLNLSDRMNLVHHEAFQYLDSVADIEGWDLIFLDPPSFVRGHRRAKRNIKNYRKINALALSRLNPGGILATSICSYHVSMSEFMNIIKEISNQAGRRGYIFHIGHSGPDHPGRSHQPEPDYLKSIFIQFE